VRVLAAEQLRVSGAGYGLMLTALGVGAFLGSPTLLRVPRQIRPAAVPP